MYPEMHPKMHTFQRRSIMYAFTAGIFAACGGVLGNSGQLIGSHPYIIHDLLNICFAPIKADEAAVSIVVSFMKWKFFITMAGCFLFTWMLFGMAIKLSYNSTPPLVTACTTTIVGSITFGLLLYKDYDGTMWWSSFGLTSIGLAYLFPVLFDHYYIHIKNTFVYLLEVDEKDEKNKKDKNQNII